MEECKKCNTGGSKSMLEKVLKWNFITSICLVVLIAVIVITFQLLVVYETSEFETTYETVTVEEF